MNVGSILQRARRRGVMIATAESCTGGMVAVALTAVPGSSDVVERGFVTYSNQAKIDLLGVSPDSLSDHGAVSEQVALEMAQGALRHSQAQLAVSVTGVAGPGGSDRKPEGRVCFGIAGDGLKAFAETREFGPVGRGRVRELSRDHALSLLFMALS